MSAQNMGKSLIRAKKKRQLANRANFQAILEQEQRQHEAQETAPKLKSVWQTSNLEDVLHQADQKLAGYTADRDVRVVVSGAVHVVSQDKLIPELESTAKDWFSLSSKLSIPQRPRWDFRMSAHEVEQQEKVAFVEWRRELARVEENDKVLLTPYEKNLEVWRQLWRVVERSDVVLEIVDARNPLTFRSQGLERYISLHHTKAGKAKPCILLLNKADLLSELQRKAWADYFQSQGVKFFFFSAKTAIESAPEVEPQPAPKNDSDTASETNELADEEFSKGESRQKPAVMERKERRRKDRKTSGAPTVHANPYALAPPKTEAESRRQARENAAKQPKPLSLEEIERDARLSKQLSEQIRPWDVLNPTTLLDAIAVMRADLGVVADESIMVGMTGYPNVGKSSTINAILACKRVVVSATPGKTKHFQTLPIPNERRIVLCDCPGLVFPSFASTKESMVCDGILPVDTCKDYMGAVALVCRRVPRVVLEHQYLVLLEKEVDVDESASHAELFLNQLSRRKGYMTEHDKPNRYRSAQLVLKEYVDGKLLYCHPPPNLILQDPTLAASRDDVEEEEEEAEDDGDWEDISEADDARQLSERSESEASDEPETFSFFATTIHAHRRILNTAEVFNLERNMQIAAEAEAKPVKRNRKKVNPQLVPDLSCRINSHGEKELLIDDDDDIVICNEAEKKEKQLSKKSQRRKAKQGILALRGAKPAAPHGLYSLSAEALNAVV